MTLNSLTFRSSFEQKPKLAKASANLNSLLAAIAQKPITPEVEQKINDQISSLNAFSGAEEVLVKQIKSTQSAILKILETDLQLVPKNRYLGLWMAVGMSAFGIPFGVMFGTVLGNMAFLGIGLPIGLGIGTAIGSAKDKKAMEEGRQLDWLSK